MIRLAACALLCLGSCMQSPRAGASEQLVIVIDESGRRVPGAMVALMECDVWPQTDPSDPATFTARTDRSGVAHFRDLPAWGYYCDAYLEPRASIPQGDDFIETVSLPGEPVTLTLQELHVGGLDAPGLRWIAFRQGNDGPSYFLRADYRYIGNVQEIEDSLAGKFPAGRFLIGLREGHYGPTDRWVEVEAEWYGYLAKRWQILMEPYSQFQSPHVVRPEDLQPCAWAEVPVRLMEPGGAPVPPATRDAILRKSALLRQTRGNGEYYRYYLPEFSAASGWTIAAPCANYHFDWAAADWRWGDHPLSSHELTADTQEIATTLPAVVRLVRVHVDGPPGEFSITPQYEIGTETSCRPRPDGVVELILQPGDWELDLAYYYSDHEFERFHRKITVEDVDVQDLVWTVTRN